jgi:hypothetical protein
VTLGLRNLAQGHGCVCQDMWVADLAGSPARLAEWSGGLAAGMQRDNPQRKKSADAVRAHTCVMREADFHDAETLLIQLSHLARPNREAALILERVKLYLADQFDRGDHPYVLPAEFAAAGKTTCRFFPREGDTLPKHQ